MSEKIILLILGSSLGMGFVGSLLNKIVWDWLKNREGSDVKEKTHCEDHANCTDRITTNEQCIARVKKDHGALEARFESHLEYIRERFDQGDTKMSSMDKSIKSIDRSITRLVTIIEERSENNKSLLQKG